MDCLLSYLFDSSVASRFKRSENIAIAHTSVARVATAIVLRDMAGTIIGSKLNSSHLRMHIRINMRICYANQGICGLITINDTAEVMMAYAFL